MLHYHYGIVLTWHRAHHEPGAEDHLTSDYFPPLPGKVEVLQTLLYRIITTFGRVFSWLSSKNALVVNIIV